MSGSKLAQEIKYLVPDAPVVLISGRTALPATELVFVDAHFGFATSLDDLLWTIRILVQPKLVALSPQATNHRETNRQITNHRPGSREMRQWADST